jgi:hypothetical protein
MTLKPLQPQKLGCVKKKLGCKPFTATWKSNTIKVIVPDGKGQGQPACQKEWKKCEEENE